MSSKIYVDVFADAYAHVHKQRMAMDYKRLVAAILTVGKEKEGRYIQATLANACDTTQATVSRWRKGQAPESDQRSKILAEAKRLGINVREYGSDPAAEEEITPNVIPAPLPNLEPAGQVPVRGAAMGTEGSDFVLRDDIVEYVAKPTGIARVSEVYALYVMGTSMIPKYAPGDLIFVQPTRAPVVGEDVVIQIRHRDGEIGGYIKTLERSTSAKLRCLQYNPRKTLEFDVKKVVAVHRVIPYRELFLG